MKLHLPKSLRTALLSCLAAISPWSLTLASGAISVGAVAFVLTASEAQASASFSDATTVVDDVTYAGYILSLDVPATSANFHAQTFECTYLNPSGQEVTANIGTSNAGPCNQPGWYYFANGGSITSTAGNTLHLTGIENDVTMTTTFSAFSIGGLIVDGQEQTNYTYTLGRPGAKDYEIYFEAASETAVNADINSNVTFNANHATAKVLFKNSGTWDIASGIKLSFETPVLTFQNTVTDLVFCGGGEVDMGGASVSIASGAKVSIGDNTTLRLGNNATAATGTGVLSNSGQIYLNNHSNAFTLVNNEGGTVIVSGASSIGSISNAGILRFDEGSSLTLGSMVNDFYGGKTYDVGNLALTSGGAVSNWAPYFGYNDGTEMTYQDGHLTVTVDGSGYYWKGTADSYSWSAANLLKGGNAAAIAAGGRLYLTADAAYKTVNMDTTVALGGIVLQSDGYTLNVTADNALPSQFVVGDSSYTLTKTGAATLTMTSAQIGKLAGITVNEGDLLVSDRSAVGKPITVNQGGTVVFGGDAAGSVNTTVNGNGRVEVDFVTTGNHSRHAKLGTDFAGTLALTGLFELTACQVGSSASYEFAAGEFWTNGGTVSNNISVVGDSADAFRMRSGGNLTLTGKVTGNYSVGHSSNTGTIILSNINSGSGTVDLDYGTLQLGNDGSTGAISGTAFDNMVVNAASGTTLVIKIKASDSNTAEGAYQLGSTLNISGTVDMNISDGSYHFAEEISLSEGAKLTINNGWDKNQFFSAIDAANATIVMAAANQSSWNTAQRLFLLNSDGDFNLQGSKIELKSAARGEYVHGLAVQKAGALSGAEVSFSSDDSDKGSVLLFTNADYREATAVTNATRVDGTVAGLSGTKGKVYAAGLTINTAAEKSYTYGGELHIASLTKSGAGSQSLTQGLNLSGALTVEGGSLTLAGIVSVGSIANSGLIDVAGVTSLSVADMDTSIGSSYEIGNITGYDTIGWNALLGVEDTIRIGYSDGQLIFAYAGQSVVWQGGTGATWDTTGAGDLVTDSWHDGGDGVYVPDATSAIVLGNAETLTNAGIDSSAVSRDIVIDADAAAYSLTVQDAYTFVVEEGGDYTLDAPVTLEDNGSIAKAGEGKLTLTSGLTTNEVNVQAGTLVTGDITLASGTVFTKSGNGTLQTGALTINEANVQAGTLVTGDITLASGTVFTKSGNGMLQTGSLTINEANVTGQLQLNSVVLVDGDVFTKSGTGIMTLSDASNILGKNITVNGGELHITQTGNNLVTSGTTFTVTVAEGATLDDDRRLSITGGSLTVTGGGIYELEGICLSGQGSIVTTLNVEADTVLHITGTTQSNAGGEGSFMLSNWPAGNTINIEGLLVSEAAMSNRDGEGTINIENGGALQLNAGMSRVEHGEHQTIINVKTGGALIVNSDADQTTGIGFVTTTLADGSTVFTTAGATIHNTLAYDGTVQLGAAAGTVLSLTATAPNVGAITILGTGDVVTALSDGAVADIAAGGTVKYTNAVTATAITLNTGAQFEATAGLSLTGALTLGANAEASLGGAVSIESLAGKNAGVLTFAELSSLELKDFVFGADYNIGTVTNGADMDWKALLGYTNRQQSISYDAETGMLRSVFNDIVWSSAADDDITWGGSDNWVMGGESVAVEATDSVLLGTIGDSGVSSTIQLAANTTVAGVTVQDAYSFSVAKGETYSFDAGTIVLEEGGSLRKVGAGTLSMSSEDAVAAKLNIAEGTLSLSDTLTDSESGSRVNLTALTGAGTLSITAAGASGVTGNGTGQRTSIDLADSFTGTLAVVGGNLDMASTIGGAGSVLLDGATLVGTGSIVQELGWNVEVSDNGAYLRRFGNANRDERDSYATRLTGSLTGSAEAMLTVIDSGEWFLAGDMSAYQGGLSINGSANYVTFESSASLASLSAVDGSHILVDNGATLTAPSLAVSGTLNTGATEGATLNLGAVTVAADGTLKIDGTGAHNISALSVANNSVLELTAGTNAAITDSAAHGIGNGNAVTIKVGEGATLTDSGSWQLTGSTMTVQGGGEYKLNSLVLSANQAGKTTVNVESGTTLHITGTATNNSKQDASFGLGHWNADNAVNVRGVLELECGISSCWSYSNTATITVEDGGKIAFNNGLHAAGKDNAGVININGGGVLEVSGTNVSGTNLVTVNVATNGIVMGGNANGATESLIANDLSFGQGAYFGAKKGTTLTIAPEDGSTDMNWLVILGDGTEVSTDNAGGMVAFDGALNVSNNVYIRKGGSLGIAGNLTTPLVTNMGGLVFDGADTITLGQAIKNAGTVEILNAADTQFVLNNAMLQEVAGVSKTWTLVNNTGVEGLTGTITGWDTLGLGNFLLDGSALQQGDWDGVRIEDGKVMLYMLSRYWDATGADGVWNTGADANWREFADATETVTFETNSRVTFTDTDETGAALDKSVTVADGGVHAKSVTITGSDYVFSGGKVLVNQSLSALQNARFDSAVAIGSSAPLQLDVADGATLTLSTLETVSTQSYGGVSYGSGAFSKTGAGTLLITDAINGTITGATVSGGKLALGSGVNLAVGANTVTGGSLGNVELLSSGTVTDYTGATVQANNVIKSADGVNYAVLTDVELRAGAATGYASLQKVAFAGNSSLSGYITYESTKQQRQMAVATGGKLTVSNLTFDLHGLSAGTKVLIENGAVEGAAEGFKGELEGWNSDNVTLLYSGIAVNSAVVDMKTAGVVALNTAESNNKANMYWDGLVAGAASSAWDKSSANWSTAAGTDGSSAFLALSNAYFGATPEGGSKEVNAAQDMVMGNMFVTEGYSFTGSRLATLGNMHITPASGAVSFANDLVAQGNVTLSAAKGGSLSFAGMLQAGGIITANVEGALRFDNAVSAGGKVELNAQNLEVNGALRSAGDVSISSGTKTAGGAGSLTIGESGSITGANVTINVNAGAESDTHYRDYVVESAGNITATAEGGKVSFSGNGAAHITGTVTADEIVVDTQSSNGIIFRQLDTDTLTITEGSYAALTDETTNGQQETSRIGTIQLGGRLGLTQFAGTYSGYNLVTTSATATVDFATIAKVTFASVKGEQLADGTFGSIVFNDSYRELTVNKLETVNNITFGAGEYWAKLYNAKEAIHGNLTVRGGGGLHVYSDNIMANGKGAWYIGGPLYLEGTTQTLAGNAVHMVGAVISGTHDSGMNFTADSQIYYTANNTISANMTVAEGTCLTIVAGDAEDNNLAIESGHAVDNNLTLSGNLKGGGDVQLTGSGCVSLGAANAFTGTMTVQGYSQLRLDDAQALASANLVLAQNGVLIVDRSAVETPFTIGALALGGGALQINNLMGMDAVSAQDAALKLGALNTRMTNTLDLTLSFTSGGLETMKTYNLFTADASYSLADIAKLLNLNLSVVNGTETLNIASNQYKLVYDADSNVIAIRTMLGNIWDGGTDGDGDGIWSTDNTHKNWSGSDYDQATAFNDAIFADLTGEGAQHAVVTIQGTVNPGDVYFESGTTVYELNATADGAMLAAGNVIHKAGAADVTLNLANNDTAANALGGLDLQAGTTKLASDLAVAGEVSVAAGDTITLQTGANKLLMVGGNAVAYTAQGTYSGLTMDATGIAGVSGAPGTVTNGIISGAAELNSLNLTGTGTLTGVTIGSGVTVATDATYTLSGLVAFNDTLQNNGTVNFAEGVTVELGGLSSNLSADGTSYIYQLVQGGTINGLASGITEQDSGITASDVFINGVNLSAGLADGIATVLSSDNGTVRISIGKELEGGGVDGSIAVPVWDARWGEASEQPSLAKRYNDAAQTGTVIFSNDDGYLYGNIVNAENAAKVNGGSAIVVNLAEGAFATDSHSEFVAGASGETYAGYETWIYDQSDVYQVVAGQYAANAQSFDQMVDTHLLVDAQNTESKGWVVGGSWTVGQQADSYVTVKNGLITNLVGAGVYSAQTGTAHVYVDGGTVTNIYGAGYGNGASLSADASKNPNAVEMLLTGGTLTSVYGGSVDVTGNIAVTVEGNATITTLYGGSMNGGEVTGNINLDLISGSITTVHAAGASGSTLTGNVTVTLHNDDVVTGALYGGKQTTNKVNGDYTSTLYFAEANTAYNMTGVTVQGFDTFTLADGAHVKVSTQSGFATDSDSGVLTISGHGKVELVGNTDFARNITLTNGATLWFNSDYAGNAYNGSDSRRLLTATAGTTIEITGQPTDGDGVCVWLDLAGHGADGNGALYKALVGAETTPSGKVAMPKVTITESASINAEDNIYFIDAANSESELILKGNTLTKVGEADLVLYNSTVTDTSANDTDAGVDGTIFVKEGTLGTGYGMRAAKTNIVLSSGSELNIIDIGTAATNIGALSGSGSVALNKGLVITTSSAGSYGKGSDWMTEGADAYSQFSADSGFAYGVYSGTISGSNSLSVKGDAVQYLSGSDSTFTGGVHMQDSATLYLMAGSSGSAVQGNSTVTAGVVGTGTIAWDSADAKLYLGNGVQVFNAGTTNVANSNMIIGVEAAPHGDALSNYVGVNSKGADGVLYITVGGKEYVEIDTHNLQSITCDGMYADGTAYVAGTEIDRNKMLLVEKSVWELNTATVAGFSAGGYNTATYSGVLSGNANLVKVGLGTLILDQTNTYTGETIIREGSLVLKGWAQIGGSADSAALNVTQTAGSTLMLAYDGTYGNEIEGISNDMSINGEGDVRWTTESATNNATAALISSVSGQTPFTLSGDISGDGNLLHCGSGTLVLSGDSSFTGGTHATRGVVEVQSATGLGAGAVVIDSSADLHVTVEEGTTASRVATTLATAGTKVQGDVVISGTESTERILNVATGGYDAPTTTVNDNGTLLVNGAGVAAATGTLSGTGTVAVSDATGTGAKATVGQMTAYTGDFVVEGNNASITVENGNYSGGSISVSGNDAVLSTKGDITITNGESLSLSSRGNAGSETADSAYVTTTGAVSVASGATLSVSDAATSYEYNLQNLQAAASLNGAAGLKDGVAGELHGFGANTGADAEDVYSGFFNTDGAMNQKAAGAVKADGGLTLAAGATYETAMANTSLMGGSLTLESGLTLSTTLDLGQGAIDGAGRTTQLVLFSDVNSVNFVLDNLTAVADADGGIYYTKAENYISGSYIDEDTWLVYDSGAGVVYLDGIVPEPTTATLSLLALAALAARRRRR